MKLSKNPIDGVETGETDIGIYATDELKLVE